jgi:hypothetical protein
MYVPKQEGLGFAFLERPKTDPESDLRLHPKYSQNFP